MRCVWQESSVEKFGAVHKKLKDGGNEETTRGKSLRELHRFFKEHDKDEGYAGLRRIADEDGTAVWTILKETEVAAQLEQRTKERHKENGGDTATPGLALANRELELANIELKAENEKQKQLLIDAQNQTQLLIEAAAGAKKGTSWWLRPKKQGAKKQGAKKQGASG